MRGFDISEFQAPGVGLDGDFVIIRACNGRREDFKVDLHVPAARGRNVRVSLYAYCEPGGGNPETQADRLCTVADRHRIRATLWADIEEGGGDLRWFEDHFVARTNARGYKCGVYSGDYFWGAHNLDGAQGKWKAAYGSNNGTPQNAPRQPWDIWQYTSKPIDTNTASQDAVNQLFGAGLTPQKPAWLEEEPIYG